MKIAFIISTGFCISPYNGIRVQAETWAEELERQGHEVVRINPWESQDWKNYDAIHLFGFSDMLDGLSRIDNNNIFFSPIIDSFQPVWKYRLSTLWGCDKLRLVSHNYVIRKAKPYIRKWCVRTKFEAEYVRRGYDVPEDRIILIPLSFRCPLSDTYPHKESFCLHVSNITARRKNVEKLIDASIKYKFKLVLAGSADASFGKSRMKTKIESNENIEYVGRVSDTELDRLYKAAKVFALPSIGEGVGLVALEAASQGCDIVVTNVGGPKEYYNGLAFEVDPYSVDSIGQSVLSALKAVDRQPLLMRYIAQNYNLSSCINQLAAYYGERF